MFIDTGIFLGSVIVGVFTIYYFFSIMDNFSFKEE